MRASPAPDRLALRTGAILGLLGVILGAFAAHFLKDRLGPHGLDVWRTGLLYQWFHALALLALAGRIDRGPIFCWLVGTLFFSGSLYLLALAPTQTWAGPLTPLGGLAFLVGWVWCLVRLGR